MRPTRCTLVYLLSVENRHNLNRIENGRNTHVSHTLDLFFILLTSGWDDIFRNFIRATL